MKLYFAPKSRANPLAAWLLYELDLDFEIERFELGARDTISKHHEDQSNARMPMDDGDVRITRAGPLRSPKLI